MTEEEWLARELADVPPVTEAQLRTIERLLAGQAAEDARRDG